ncbi:TonB-dependent receptor [Oxalobacter sp. OttesenSCG-928-P03]|nr:TonB-dependent receptor [Oxalobacter sp. OttesenSCG-928-P03]
MKKAVWTLCASLLFQLAFAEEPDKNEVAMDPVLVTARGYATSQSNTPGGVAVVTEREIALAPKGSIVDALQRIPGIARTGDSPWAQDISIRGLSGPSVVVLLNGKRINTATDLNFRLGIINPADVERIEVLKGPVSALYGTGSIGGVVNIITRKPSLTSGKEVHGRVALSGSSNPEGGNAYGNVSLSGPAASGLVAGAWRDYSDTYGGHHTNVPNSEFRDKQARAVFNLKPYENLMLSFEALKSVGHDIGIPGGPSSMPELARVMYPRTEFSFLSMDATLDVNAQYLKMLEASFYYSENKRHVQVDRIPPATTGAYPLELRPRTHHENWGGKVQGTFEAGAHTLVSGLEFWRWSVETSRYRSIFRPAQAGGPIQFYDNTMPDPTQTSFSLFAEDNWEVSKTLTVNLGGRLEYLNTKATSMYEITPVPNSNSTQARKLYDSTDEDDYGYHLHAGLTWRADKNWSHSFLVATSYRAADLMERFKYVNLGGSLGALYGNPNLDPERTYYAEYGLRYDNPGFHAGVRLFANIITDYIAEKRVSPTRIELDNVDDARIYGAEVDARWQFHRNWAVYGDVTALYGRDKQKDQALPGVAPISGQIGLDYRQNGFWANVNSRMIAPQNSTPENVETAKGVILLNAALGYRFESQGLKHDFSLTLDNIFDTRYYNYLANQRGYRVWEPGIVVALNYSVSF